MKSLTRSVFLCLLFLNLLSEAAIAATIKMRIVAVNPSAEKTKTTSIKSYLPKEVTLKDIKDNGGLEVQYDAEQGLYYVSKEVLELAPSETKTFEIILDDVWMVPEEKIQDLRERANRMLEHLKDTHYTAQADTLVRSVHGRTEEIQKTQNDQGVTKQQHIAYFRDNMKLLDAILADLAELEKMLVAVGGPPTPEIVQKSELDLKSPSSKTTWIIIFIILVFVAILGGSFYFIWMGQERITENIFKKEKDVSYSEFKKAPHDESQGNKDQP